MKFPDSPMFAGLNAPSRIEADVNDLEVEGELPREIDGAFYRVAADHQFPPRFATCRSMVTAWSRCSAFTTAGCT